MIQNGLSDFRYESQKVAAYVRDVKSKEIVYAYKSDGSRVPLRGQHLYDVEHIGGLWRVQDVFPYEIEKVRGKDFVIGQKLPRIERTLFDFYAAYSVGENCYGKYISGNADYIVAKYITNRGIYSAYGKTIEDARAYLGIKMYDEYQNVIHAAINSEKQK